MFRIVFMFVVFTAVTLAATLLAAQFVCWGLSIMHVSTGLAGPYLVLAGISMVAGVTSTIGSQRQ